jgi:transposase-like protein
MSTERKYDDEFKRQAVKLAKGVGTRAAVTITSIFFDKFFISYFLFYF